MPSARLAIVASGDRDRCRLAAPRVQITGTRIPPPNPTRPAAGLRATDLDTDIDARLDKLLIGRLKASLRESAPKARDVPDIIRGSFGAASLPMFYNFSPR